MANFGPLMAEISSGVWDTPASFNGFRVMLSLLQRRCSPEADQTLHDVWPSPVLVHYTHFWGLLLLMEFCPVQNLLYVQVLRSPLSAALLHGTPAAGVSQTLRRGTRNGITELSQRAPPIFCWTATTLGIGPHSRWFGFCMDQCTAFQLIKPGAINTISYSLFTLVLPVAKVNFFTTTSYMKRPAPTPIEPIS